MCLDNYAVRKPVENVDGIKFCYNSPGYNDADHI